MIHLLARFERNPLNLLNCNFLAHFKRLGGFNVVMNFAHKAYSKIDIGLEKNKNSHENLHSSGHELKTAIYFENIHNIVVAKKE